jgi:hypothetical protein
MRIALLILIFFLIGEYLPAQSDDPKYIFIPHPRSEDKVHQSVLPAIEQINFSLYSMTLLGGDLTYYTSIDRTSMNYLDSLFDLDNLNTLWTRGNHDLNNPGLNEEYTGRPGYYSYGKNNITFLVLNTEIDADGFISSHITGDQLQMVENVCDTVANSDYLVLLHHRLLWMIGDDYFSDKIDSVGESTRQLDTSNFNTVVFPLLQKAKSRGVKVLCLGGDKSKINIEYSPEDSITYIASTMAPEYTDKENDVVILTHSIQAQNLSWEFVPLDQVEKNVPPVNKLKPVNTSEDVKILYCKNLSNIEITVNSEISRSLQISIYTLTGAQLFSGKIIPNQVNSISIENKGLYIVKLESNSKVFIQKIYAY